MIRQLLYHSRATREMSQSGLQDLLHEARDLNQKHGITGLLFYIERHFMQCIEGPPEAIGQLAANIKSDQRNTDFSILLDHEIKDRAFPDWTMGFRAYACSELQQEPGFHHIQSSQDLDSLSASTDTAYELMCSFYRINAGRGF